jgi:hypothetical protein
MNVTFACPLCQAVSRVEFSDATRAIGCPHCGTQIEIPGSAVEPNRVARCLVCPSTDLFVRKDFPQRIGVALVAIGIVGSSIAWAYGHLYWTFGILFATALADVLLYTFVGDQLMCYRCHAEYRGVGDMESHGSFDLETHERHRQISARLTEAKAHVPSATTSQT